MFGTVLSVAVTAMQLYVFWRAGSVPLLQRHLPRGFLIGVGLLLWLGFVLSRGHGHGGSGGWAAALELFGMHWMAVLFLATVCLLAVDLITGFGWVLPRLAPRVRGWALLAGAALSILALVQGLRSPVVQRYEVRLPGLPPELDGTVLVALSDLHLGSLLGRPWLEARVAQVQAEQPNLVVLLGDFVEGHGAPPEDFLPALRRLTAPLGVWAVLGNHESHGGEGSSTSLLQEAGYQVLSNRWVQVRPGLVLAGADGPGGGLGSRGGEYPLDAAQAGRPAGATILLAHVPRQAAQAAAAGVGLLLSGHTHGGQLWPFGYLVQRVNPMLGGRYELAGGASAIVCRGTGTWGPRMRLWRPAEILRVVLRSGAPSPQG
jgi:predicted MPP superfamily phosphohydrolase